MSGRCVNMKNEIFESVLFSTFVNIVCYIFLLGLLFSQSNTMDKQQLNIGKNETEVLELNVVATENLKPEDDFSSLKDDAIQNVSKTLLVGEYHVSDKIKFCFGANGLYSGFFDNSNQNVNGYRYKIRVLDGEPILYIYNKDETSMVSYKIVSVKFSEAVLYYEKSDLTINLKMR